jgi:hypothetical protein
MANIVIGQNYFCLVGSRPALTGWFVVTCGDTFVRLPPLHARLRVQRAPGVFVRPPDFPGSFAHNSGASRREMRTYVWSRSCHAQLEVTSRSLIIDSETGPESSLIPSAGRPRATEPPRKARDQGCLSTADKR